MDPQTLLLFGVTFVIVAIFFCINYDADDDENVHSALLSNNGEEGNTEKTTKREKNYAGKKYDTIRGSKSLNKSFSQDTGTKITLEVITGPSLGLTSFAVADEPPYPVLRIGRSVNSTVTLADPEVSSRHAEVSWNHRVRSWQVIDKGSLNGTSLNSQPISFESSTGVRKDGTPTNLSDGDVISTGSETRILVRIAALLSSGQEAQPSPGPPASSVASPSAPPVASMKAPFSVGLDCDPLFSRKGGKPLPMEDVPHCEWPLRGLTGVGIFCIFDGHAGKAAAENSCRILPEKLATILKKDNNIDQVREEGTAESVLREAFIETESELPNEDEGCTATVLMVWKDAYGMFVAQTANVGDSHCVLGFGGQQLVLTEDHRLTGPVEKQRLKSIGKGLREGETRLCGMNIARVLGDKFLKNQNVGLSADPYVSQPVSIGDGFDTVAVVASDGLWDVISPKRAIQLILECKSSMEEGQSADMYSANVASALLVSRAKLAKTQDNTTAIVIDFGVKSEFSEA